MAHGDHLVIPDGFMRTQFLMFDIDTNHTSVLAFDSATDGSGASQGYADTVAGAVGENLMPLLGNKLTLSEVVVITGSAAPPYLSQAFAVSTETGGAADNSEPQVQALVKLTSATPGKHGRGRRFIPRPDGNQINSRGAVTPGYQTELLTAFNAVGAVLLASSPAVAPAVIFHMKNAANPTPPAPSPITGAIVSQLVATQRRRLAR